MVSSDELMRVIAKRLGLPEDQVVPADELSSVFSVSSAGSIRRPNDIAKQPPNAPRDKWIDDIENSEFDANSDEV